MKKIVLWAMSTLTVVTLMIGYHTSTAGSSAATGTAGGNATAEAPITGTTGTGSTASSAPSSSAAPSAAPSSASSTVAKTVTGSVAQTRYGPVQVQLTVAGGKITAARVVQYPDGSGRDQEINSQALPVLVQETLNAQSAKIDMVSGATYTSGGYVTSLQSALDKAGL